MTADTWHALRNLFRQWTGMMLPETMRPKALGVVGRLAAAAGHAPRSFLDAMDGDNAARQLLLDELGLGTTWFMRDEGGLRALVTRLAQTTSQGQRPVWLWSAGCSSGEEVYSLAMCLADEGISARILGTDLNRLALQRAIEGRYPERSLQRVQKSWRWRYFEEQEDGAFRVRDEIRASVSFELHNVLTSEGPPHGWYQFDAVVCRNVLIYFERGQAISIIERLARTCRPGGFLLLGAIERPLFWMSSLATREQVAEFVELSGERQASRSPLPSLPAVREPPASGARAQPSGQWATPEHTVQVEHLLDRAAVAEQDGRIDDALSLIDAAITRAPLWAPAHLARGLVLKHAGRQIEAIDSLRASRFLDDHAWLAPYQLAMCLDAVGEPEDALEAYRHALGVLETRGKSGLYQSSSEASSDVDTLASTAAEVCRGRIASASS
jgi:chemotaxis methyl-accepting protein methylase